MLQRPCRSTQPPHVWEARLANQVSLNGTAADAGTGMDATSSNVDPSHLLTREHCCYGFLYSSDLGFPLDSVQSFLGEPRHSRYNSGDSSQDKSIYEGLSGFLGKSFPSTVLLCSRVSYWITSRTNWLFLYGPGSENIRLGGTRCFHREYSVLLLQNNNQRQHTWPRNMLQWNFTFEETRPISARSSLSTASQISGAPRMLPPSSECPWLDHLTATLYLKSCGDSSGLKLKVYKIAVIIY